MPALTTDTRKRTIRTLLLLVFCALFQVEFPSADPGAPDSVLLESISIEKGEPATVEVWTVTDEWLTGLEITLTWDWSNLVADSFLFEVDRFPSAMVKGYIPDTNTLTIFAFPSDDELISTGHLQLGTIFFDYPDTAQARTIIIDTTTLYLSDSMIIRSNVFTDTIWGEPFIPQFQSAELTLNVCCLDFTGNTNCDIEGNVDLADITTLIDRVYLTKTPLCCEAAGNVDGDIEQLLDLADIVALIDHVYISKEPTAPCL